MTGDAGELLYFLLRILLVCAVFFPVFLCRALGGGDIKLMALCVGILGVSDGIFVLFLGLFLSAVSGSVRLIRSGTLWERLLSAADFAIRIGRERGVSYYPRAGDPEGRIRLAPYLAGGYLLYLLWP